MEFQYQILGTDPATGKKTELIVDAVDEVEADAIARERGVVVRSVGLYKPSPSGPPQTSRRPPSPSINAAATLVALAIIGAPVIGLVLWARSCFDVATPTAAPVVRDPVASQFSAWDGSHKSLTAIIKEMMNDPDSYEHVRTVYHVRDNRVFVRTTFRGTNVYGGVVTNSIAAEFDMDGNLIRIVDGE